MAGSPFPILVVGGATHAASSTLYLPGGSTRRLHPGEPFALALLARDRWGNVRRRAAYMHACTHGRACLLTCPRAPRAHVHTHACMHICMHARTHAHRCEARVATSSTSSCAAPHGSHSRRYAISARESTSCGSRCRSRESTMCTSRTTSCLYRDRPCDSPYRHLLPPRVAPSPTAHQAASSPPQTARRPTARRPTAAAVAVEAPGVGPPRRAR